MPIYIGDNVMVKGPYRTYFDDLPGRVRSFHTECQMTGGPMSRDVTVECAKVATHRGIEYNVRKDDLYQPTSLNVPREAAQ